jgi:hypothetical protein
MATTAEPLLASDDVRTNRRLRTAGILAIAASALGSVLVASPAVSEAPSTDHPCRIQIVGDQWYGSGCAPVVRSAR